MFYYLNTGQLLKEEHNFKKLNAILASENIQQIYSDNELGLGAILKLLTLLMTSLHSNKFFLKSSLIKLPYIFNQKQHFNLNYNSLEQCFELITKDSFILDSFSSVKFQFEFKLILEQIMFFEISNDFEGLCGDVNIQNPPTYVFN